MQSRTPDRVEARARAAALLAAVLLLTAAAYAPSFGAGLTNWDDAEYLRASDDLGDVFMRFDKGNYHPLTPISLALDSTLPGGSPFIHHLGNLLLHGLVTALVFALACNLLGAVGPAALTALVFGLHPLHVESVAWISARKDLLYAFFYFAGLLTYLRHARAPAGGSAPALAATAALFVLSLLSKGMAVAFPLSLITVDALIGRAPFSRRSLLEKAPFFALSTVFGLIAIAAQRSAGQLTEAPVWSPLERLSLASAGYVQYWLKLLLPTGLSAFHPYPTPEAGGLPPLWSLWPVAAAGFAGLYALALRRRARVPAFAIAFVTLNLVLVLQLLAVGGALLAERYSYVASFGFCLAVGWGAFQLRERAARAWPAAAVLGLVWLTALGVVCHQRALVWQDSLSLWDDVIAQHPDVAVARLNRGVARVEAGDLPGARADLDAAVQLAPGVARAWAHRGVVRASQGELREGLLDLDRAVALAPDSAPLRSNRGHLRERAGDPVAALADYDRAIALQPDFGLAWYNRARLRLERAGPVHALPDAERAAALLPELAEAQLLLGQTLLDLGRSTEACPRLARAGQLGSQAGRALAAEHCAQGP
jgi:tetratricopeptide (TPR) repeat protein